MSPASIVHGLAVHRAQDRDARRPAGAGDEDARCAQRTSRDSSRSVSGVAPATRDAPSRRCRARPRAARRSAPARSGPVARGRAQELLVEVAADLDLGRVGLDDLDLALEVLVDRDEAGGLELDGRRRRLVAEDPRDSARGDERRAVGVAVVLVDVADRVRVHRARPDLLDDLPDLARSSRSPSLTLVSSSSAWTSRAPMSSAARCGLRGAVGRRSPPASPPVSVRIVTWWPWATCRSRMPPTPISTSSGCAPTASTTSAPGGAPLAGERDQLAAPSRSAPAGSIGFVR